MQKKQNLLIVLATGIFLVKSAHAATPPTYTPGPSSGKISGAPGEVPQQPSPVISPENVSTNNLPVGGPGAQTLQGYNPANDNPGLYHGLPPEMPEGLTQAPETFWRCETMFGDVWGARNFLENQGFEFDPAYVGEVFGNVSGGMKQGVVYDHVLNLPLTVYLDKIAGWWDGGVVHANAMWIAGRSLSADKVGDISGTSNISGYPTLRLQELWYQQTFLEMRASVKVGLIAADAEFFTSDSSSLFINGTFGAFTLVGANIPDPPVYPMAAPGVSFLIQPIPQFYFQAGVFDGTTEDEDVNRNGSDFRIANSDGTLVFSEVGYLLNQAAGDRGLVGTYKLGSFVHTADFADLNSGAGEGANFGIYGVADQEIYKHGGKDVYFFTRAGYAPSNVNTIDWYFDAGFNFSGFIPGRLLDTAGIAVARSNFSHDFSDSQVTGGSNPFTQETVIEATYKAQITTWWTVQPDFQYIVNPSGQQGSHDAAIFGLRTTIVF
jgi:porin